MAAGAVEMGGGATLPPPPYALGTGREVKGVSVPRPLRAGKPYPWGRYRLMTER